jgi:hypothetical protein
VKLPGPKAAKLLAPSRLIPTAIEAKISGDEVLLLQSIYAEERGSPMARSLIRQFAIAYGESIRCKTLRHAILAYAAVLLPPEEFGECSERHASEATTRLICRISAPETVDETHVFAAGMLMWRLWVRNCKDVALIHAHGVIKMLSLLREKGEDQSPILRVFGPLAFSDANFYISMCQKSENMTSSQSESHRTTFTERLKYHHQMIRSGGPAIVWCSAKVQTMADILWDMQRVMLELVMDLLQGGTRRYDENDSRVKYLWSEYNDPDFQKAIAAMEWTAEQTPSRFRCMEEEVQTYLLHQLLCIRLLIVALTAPSISQGLSSPEAQDIAYQQLLRGSSHPLLRAGEGFEVYTWAFVLNLGLMGLVYSPRKSPEGKLQSLDTSADA